MLKSIFLHPLPPYATIVTGNLITCLFSLYVQWLSPTIKIRMLNCILWLKKIATSHTVTYLSSLKRKYCRSKLELYLLKLGTDEIVKPLDALIPFIFRITNEFLFR